MNELDPGALTLIHEVAERFGAECKKGVRPSIDKCLRDNSDLDRSQLFQACLAKDVHFRRKAGESPTAQEYLVRFPDLAGPIEELFSDTSPSAVDKTDGQGDDSFEQSWRTATTLHVPNHNVVGGPLHRFDPKSKIIGRYRLERELGQGAFGAVFLALDREIGRRVAIKLARADKFSSQQQIDNLLREARAAGKLEHPGLVRIYDVLLFDAQPDESSQFQEVPVCAIVYQYIEGGTLADELERGKPTQERAADITARLAAALIEPHALNMVHRDLKPQNILIDARHQPIVADFGLAIQEESQLAFANQHLGTPAYMSPEQLGGKVLDGRSDIWSLGVILYQMLTHRRPFLGTRAEVCNRILHSDAKPPSQLDPSISPELEQICLDCLNRRVDKRMRSASRLASALDNWLGSVGRSPVRRDQPAELPKPHRPSSSTTAVFTWEELRDTDRKIIERMLCSLENNDFTQLKSTLLGATSIKTTLVRVIRRFCDETVTLKLHLSADNAAQIVRGLENCLAVVSRDMALYSAFQNLLRRSLLASRNALLSASRRDSTRRRIIDAFHDFATQVNDDVLLRALDQLE